MSKEKEIKKTEKKLSALQEESEKDADALAAAQQHFNAVSAGLSSSATGEDATLAEQIMTCKNEISKAVTEAKQVRIKALSVSNHPSCFFRKLSENGAHLKCQLKDSLNIYARYFRNLHML